jgi:hypothetical protein
MRQDRRWRITGLGRVIIALLVVCALLSGYGDRIGGTGRKPRSSATGATPAAAPDRPRSRTVGVELSCFARHMVG